MAQDFEIVTTADGSPTLHWSQGPETSEKMHHSGGALSESLYIYREALREVLKRGWPPRIFSLGLGLGYNEWIALASLEQREWKMWSFEAVPLLRDGFLLWLNSQTTPLASTYDAVINGVANTFQLDAQELKLRGERAFQSGQWEVRGSYPQDIHGMSKVSCVFYDAYSKKMNPELWNEAEVTQSLISFLADSCVFATYAATGALNRVLKSLDFELIAKRGFSGKRESTLAIRCAARACQNSSAQGKVPFYASDPSSAL